MNLNKYRIYPYLTLAGTLPFVIPAIFLLIGTSQLPILGDLSQLMSLYSVVIACFMAGSYWGLHLNREDGWAVYLPIFSNVIALMVFFGHLLIPFAEFTYVLMLAFVLMLVLDVELKNRGIITQQYLLWRFVATVLVVLSLIVAALKV